jgi:large subunit ribosomal protein L17
MRHHHDHRQLSRTAEHRRALLRGLVTALFEYERIETTVAKAKEARRVAERMITYAKRNNLHSRRLVARTVQNEDVAKKLFDTITPWYKTREGGYTRVLKTRRRLGDAGEMAILELVKSEEQKEADRKRRAERAAAAERAAEAKGKKAKEKAEEKPEAEDKEAKPQPKPKAKGKGPRPENPKTKGGLLGRLRKKEKESEESE